jgi:hypothetical protein
LAQFLDQQINDLARKSPQTTDALYDRIQTEYQADTSTGSASTDLSQAKPTPKVEADPQVRGL